MTAIMASLDPRELQATVQRADPSALLVPARILRRVIKRARMLTGPGLQVPHRKCFVIARDTLLEISNRHELGVSPELELPDTLLLLEAMDTGRRAALPQGTALRMYWRLLFHARVHAELARRRADGKLTEAVVRARIVRIGRPDFDAATAVLRQENMLLPAADLPEIYEEFAAVYLELRSFEPQRLPLYFPLARFETIERILALDIDAAGMLTRTRLEGADLPDTVAEATPNLELPGELPVDRPSPDAAAYARLTAAAARSRRRGNGVRAAIRSERAARSGDVRQQTEARAAARADLDQLATRLQTALDLSSDDAALWRRTLDALLGPAGGGRWTVEGRLLYDLQKICLDDEREVYAVDIVEWIVTGFRRPLRRHLPNQRLVLVLKHLRKVVARLPAVRMQPEARGLLHELVHAAVRRGEDRLRDRLRPPTRGALDSVGLVGHSRVECVARDKIVEELLDRVVERDLLTMSDLRDAVARNRVKLPDLYGPDEFLFGDKLIRANRALARNLDGIYRRGEIYLRWLQRFTSAAFATGVGRAFTRYVALPFGGAFFILEGVKAIRHELPGHHYLREHDTTWLAGHLRNDIAPTVVLGVFLLAVMQLPALRRGLLDCLHIAWRGLKAVFVDLPAFLMRLPLLRIVLESRVYELVYRFVLKPLFFAVPFALGLYLADVDARRALGGGVTVFVAMTLLLNSPLGSHVEELLVDRLSRAWQLLRRDILPGLYFLVVGVFRALLERVERLLYAVDEWLRFRTGDSKLSAMVKPVLGLAWFAIAYTVRGMINLFIEPTFNPIKHFPVVTVAAKLLFPFIPTLAPLITAAFRPVLGLWLAGLVAAAILFFIPGFAGFLVWELKENWRLYAANQPPTLQPQVVGSHGETVRRLLRPGFHSGTVPKLYAKLRNADGKQARKQQEALHHVAEALKRFVERDLLAILEHSPRWGDSWRLRAGEIHAGTNRIRIEIRCRDAVEVPFCLDIDEQAGRLLAGVQQPGWLSRLAPGQRQAFADALAGFYHLAGVNLVREEVEALLPAGACYGATETGLVVWPASGPTSEVIYPLTPGQRANLPADWPAPDLAQLVFSERPIYWVPWVQTWEAAPEDKRALASETGLLHVG